MDGLRAEDEEYAKRYWTRQPKGMKEVMEDYIRKSARERGLISHFVDPNKIAEDDKEKLSAFRLLAKQLGYEMGQYKFDKQTHTTTAEIKKIK